MKWAAEQREAIMKANAERQPPKPQLPAGYVEMGPDYRPPPGFVAIPVDPATIAQPPQQHGLPPPPAEMPPPITQPQVRPLETPPDPRRAWGMPTLPGQEPR
jgi:hypothetical protein